MMPSLQVAVLATLSTMVAMVALLTQAATGEPEPPGSASARIPGIIFDAAMAERDAAALRDHHGIEGPFWSPSPNLVQELEQMLPGFISANPPPDRSPIPDASGYRRQYVGYTLQGRRAIFINAFCQSFWESEGYCLERVVFVYDGGDCFFQLTYDPESKHFSRFSINGQA